MKEKLANFYKKFVIKENVTKINNWRKQNGIIFCFLWMCSIFLITGFSISIYGYQCYTDFGKRTLALNCVMLSSGLICAVIFLYFSEKYKIFRKWWLAPLFILIEFAILGFIMIMSLFTVKTTVTQIPDDPYVYTDTTCNMVYAFSIFLPVTFIYEIFCCYAFVVPIAQCAKDERERINLSDYVK